MPKKWHGHSLSNWHGGKGSQPRLVDSQKYSENFDKIFKKPSQPLDSKEEKKVKNN